jgi:hypothetical protein
MSYLLLTFSYQVPAKAKGSVPPQDDTLPLVFALAFRE